MKAFYLMRAFFFAFFLVLLGTVGHSVPAFAQTPIPISLDDAINTALHRGEEIDLAKGEVRSAEGNEMIARSGMLPQISASANYTRTLKS
ncbi:MAG TPA: TolC family protein, partial [Candidatus Kapabacteria bacterium]|nr:TolC family protein [Candidatus Kapabacteria bacterium]